MAEDIKNAANALVDDVLNGVSNEMNKTRGGADDKSRQRSLLCVLFTPNTWFNPERLNPKAVFVGTLPERRRFGRDSAYYSRSDLVTSPP
ncbi:Reticulon-4-like Protein [Tribolium castaneum]|uniref:Reticulon-4-like Protein n=1 Tax=Tribolium castaneum TaxID=7070 RepID=A0A139WJD9_TRICA|nr:Reticulon-4-like Protein [Tribolium castaneum]